MILKLRMNKPYRDNSLNKKGMRLKSFIRKFFLAAILITAVTSFGIAGNYQTEFQLKVIEKAVQIKQKGILKQKENGTSTAAKNLPCRDQDIALWINENRVFRLSNQAASFINQGRIT